MKISDHFWFSEFCQRDHHILTVIQMHMVFNLAQNILEPIRAYLTEYFQKDTKFKIVSGIRFPSDNNRLKKQGFNPSETSDHLFGNIVKLRNPAKIKQYGKYYQYSVGACDFMPECGSKEAFDILKIFFNRDTRTIDLPNKNPIKIGQVILEKRTSYWIHISNPKSLIYDSFVSNTFLKIEPFLQSLDNGYSYKPV